MAQTFDDRPPTANPGTAEAGQPTAVASPAAPPDPTTEIDKEYWEQCLSDAERAEREWRTRGREIIRIYRNDGQTTKTGVRKAGTDVVFNILFSNTEVCLPAIYSTPPQPVVRSRFAKKSAPPMPMPLPPMFPPIPSPPPAGAPGLQGGAPLPDGMGPAGQPGGGLPLPPPGLEPPPEALATAVPPGVEAATPSPGGMGPPASPEAPAGPPPAPLPAIAEGQPLPMMPPQSLPPPPGMPEQSDIETAAAVMEKALEIVVDDDVSHEAIKAAVKDVLLPGRGICRVRWHPELRDVPVPDPVMGGNLSLPGEPAPTAGAAPLTKQVKIWETVSDEYVYWEDILFDPVRQFADGAWIAFRHLFDEDALLAEFPDSEHLQRLKAANKLDEIVKWTDESAAKDAIGGGSAMKTADKLGDVIKKGMVWEIWARNLRKVIWFIREIDGIVLRVDPDSLNLTGFFPVPKPLLAVTTTDSMLPRPYYDLYKHLAADLDETSRRISALTEKIKVRGGYNSANRDIAGLLTANDGIMLPVDGIDMMNGGLQNHIWLVPIVEWVNALKELYLAREQIKGAIYEVMGISDIMRGNTNPYETATAQRIKGTMGTNRLEEQKQTCSNFARALLRMKAEIIAKNFDASTLTRMTGEEVTPAVEAILRDDFQRTCSIDIETDSTVAVDETGEQEGNAKMMMAIQGILTGAAGLLQTGVLPPPMVIQFTLELIKMMIHPIRGSRGVSEMITDFQEQLQAQLMGGMMPPMMMPPPPSPAGGPPGASPPQGPPPGVSGGPPKPNGSGAPMQ